MEKLCVDLIGTYVIWVKVQRSNINIKAVMGLSDEERVNLVRPKKSLFKKAKKTTQKIETVKYKVLFDHIFSDRNY